MTPLPAPRFDHLLALSDTHGTFEHALLDKPRAEHGYCTDDMARVLIVASREPEPSLALLVLAHRAVRFLGQAQHSDGCYRNRMSASGQWEDGATLDDCWGRSLWALGTAASCNGDDWIRKAALAQFEPAARRRSPWPRAMAFAALGAAELLAAYPDHQTAYRLLEAAADRMLPPGGDGAWPWPERRLTYANALLPDAMIAAGTTLDRPALARHGLELLGWLLERETVDGHLSVTPVGGAGRNDARPRFDQQPIEVATLADACARAASVDSSPRWATGVLAAIGWFLGDNDGQRLMWDPATGGGFDGLEVDGVNANEGAESTLALLSTLQRGRGYRALEPPAR